MRLPWRKGKGRLRPISEAEAYHHSYGEPSRDVRALKPHMRRRRFVGRLSGEELRRKFLERLNAREKGG
jgi:hypothetical protein